jgi:hypothetical protein
LSPQERDFGSIAQHYSRFARLSNSTSLSNSSKGWSMSRDRIECLAGLIVSGIAVVVAVVDFIVLRRMTYRKVEGEKIVGDVQHEQMVYWHPYSQNEYQKIRILGGSA